MPSHPLLTPPSGRTAPPVTLTRIRSPLSETVRGLRGDGATLLLLEAGHAAATGPGEDLAVEAPRLVWLAPGRRQEIRISPGARGVLVHLTQAALSRALPATAFGEELGAIARTDVSLPLGPQDRATAAARLDELHEELTRARPASGIMAEYGIAMLLVQIWRGVKSGRDQPGTATGGLVRGFTRLAGLHLRDHWQVGDYAAALGVSRDRLSGAVRRATGRSPQAWLHEALHREAVELLTSSGLQVSQVGFRLGFSDPAYFNRFFTRMEGTPPSRFRKRTRKPGPEPSSFAAWP